VPVVPNPAALQALPLVFGARSYGDRVFDMAALHGIRANVPSRQFHDRKRGERLIHSQALLVLARRLVDVLWACSATDANSGRARPTRPPAPARHLH
jgi:hypothetical protein